MVPGVEAAPPAEEEVVAPAVGLDLEEDEDFDVLLGVAAVVVEDLVVEEGMIPGEERQPRS